MRNWFYFLCSTVIIMITLAGCSGSNASTSAGGSKDVSAGFKEITSLDLEGPVTNMNFSLDDDGDTLLWGENDGGIGDDLRRNVWVDGEVKSLDIESWDQFAFLTQTGKLINAETNWDADVDKRHSILEYDPITDQTEKFTAQNDRDDILLPGHGTYIQDPKTYIHTETNPNHEDAGIYLWEIGSNEFTDLNFLNDIKSDVGEITSYPHYFLNKDVTTIYATVLNAGIFSYDIEAGKTDKLLDTDEVMPQGNTTTMLTADEKYLIYVTNNSEDYNLIYHALDLETKDSLEIGMGTKVFTLTNGNIAIIDEGEVKIFNFETEKLETIHKIELEENQSIDNLTVSLDGSTIAYGYTTKGEGDQEDTSHISILSNK
ncbi:hypothetical protein SAMN04487944_10324 [Gracilibacillus ureilyticus]|uniref:Uncharacterized protein n=1 Tax=Gracilibacillus ureilyticus TaxID=531814 RepID=A0A1H9N966_9BACI|nr:hypothetical protein [Gracilibacillus ureilyticus]SER32448.1 hypothetical protein SAMN04487944_10324 [Gracilibacillus ureilyticus]